MSTPSQAQVTRIENAVVWTGRQIPGTADYAVTDAIAFVGDRVLALGQSARSMAADHVIDAQGGFICHAFGDGHVHSIFGGLEQQFAPVRGHDDPQGIARAVGEWARANPGPARVIGTLPHRDPPPGLRQQRCGATAPQRSLVRGQ